MLWTVGDARPEEDRRVVPRESAGPVVVGQAADEHGDPRRGRSSVRSAAIASRWVRRSATVNVRVQRLDLAVERGGASPGSIATKLYGYDVSGQTIRSGGGSAPAARATIRE